MVNTYSSLRQIESVLEQVLPVPDNNLKLMLLSAVKQTLLGDFGCHDFTGRVFGRESYWILDYLLYNNPISFSAVRLGDIHSVVCDKERYPYHTGIFLGSQTISKHGTFANFIIDSPYDLEKYYQGVAREEWPNAHVESKWFRFPEDLWFKDFSKPY